MPASARRHGRDEHIVRAAQARQALLAAQARRAGDLAAQRLAAARADEDIRRAAALATQARDAAGRLREIETRTADTQARIETLGARRQVLDHELTDAAAALARMLPLIERLSLYPAETLLAASTTPADALGGLMVLRGLGTQIRSRAADIRARQLDLARLQAALEMQDQTFAALRREQVMRGRSVTLQAEQAAAAQRASRTAADAASRQAAASATTASTLGEAVARIEADQKAAEEAAERRLQHQVTAAAKSPVAARAARAEAAAVRADAGPGLAPGAALAAPVAGRQVQGWGASTEAGPATGVTYAPPALAMVTAPCDGRIDFAGPFRSYGRMLILDCGHGYRFVLAGLDRLDVAVGQKLARGVAIGRMPDWHPADTGHPSLYVQLRRGSQAIDPSGFLHGRS